MGNEVELLEHWRELAPSKQQKVLEFVELLKSRLLQYNAIAALVG